MVAFSEKCLNFDHMPELKVWWAYPLIWLTMLGVGLGMIGFFWRKGWIGTQSSSSVGLAEASRQRQNAAN